MGNLMTLDRTFDSFLNDFFGNDFGLSNYSMRKTIGLTNVKENEKSYELEIMLPGFTKEETNIDIDDNMIKISGNIEQQKSDDKYHRKEFYKQSFSKSFTLPDNVDRENIKAEMKDGILYLKLNKIEEKKIQSKRIAIE